MDGLPPLASELHAIEHEFPAWCCWASSHLPLCYARRMGTSPPVQLRAGDVASLRTLILAWEEARQL